MLSSLSMATLPTIKLASGALCPMTRDPGHERQETTDETGGLKICSHLSIVSGPVMRTIALCSEVGELTATIVSRISYIVFRIPQKLKKQMVNWLIDHSPINHIVFNF